MFVFLLQNMYCSTQYTESTKNWYKYKTYVVRPRAGYFRSG